VLDCSATGNGEGYLIYIAANNGASANDDWYQWDTTYPEANWWMPTPCTGDGTEAGATRTWDEWKTALAGVRVKSYALSLGSGEANTDTYVSSITVNDVVTDFESA
jgi:hypothetical protein